MGNTAIAIRSSLPAQPDPFDLPTLRRFDAVPDHCGVTALRGAVVVYDPDHIHREGVIDGAFYVVESQHPPSHMEWRRWLDHEIADEHVDRRAQPFSPLDTRRRVVQLVRHPKLAGHWLRRESSGFSDGPYPDWSICFGTVGKVVGLYAPDLGKKEAAQ